MPNETTTKKAWFKKVFGGKTKTPDPAKAIYEDKLHQVTPTIKQAAKLPAFKQSMAIQLKAIDKLVKAKQYSDATAQLDALGRQAKNALAPSLGTAPNAQALDQIARELANVVGQAKAEKLVVLRPTLQEEEAVVLKELENKNDSAARNYLEALKYRLDDIKDIKTQTVRITLEVQRLHARATLQNEGTPAEIDALRDKVVNALNGGDLTQADAALVQFQDWVRKREGLIEKLLDGLDEVKEAVTKHKLKLVPPANLDADEQTIRGLMGQGKIVEADEKLTSLKTALKPAAELHRLRQLLERLVEEEGKQPRIDRLLLFTQQKVAEGFLNAGDAKQARSAIKKIMDAIANYESKLKPEEKTKINRDRIEHKLAARLKKAQELAGSSPPENVKQLLDQMVALKPPHDAKSEAKSAELYTQILVATGNGKLEKLKGSNANGVYVLKTPDKVDIAGTKSKQFFKPLSGEDGQPGFPKGSGAGREVVGKVMGDKMSAMMGIEMNVPETNLIQLPTEFLPELANLGPSAIGSIQHHVHRKGDPVAHQLGSMGHFDKTDLYAKIPKKTQGLQVFDLVFANLDRHAGNMFVTGEGDEAELSPIDNGMGLPSKQALLLRGEAFGMHALGDLPANDDKFEPEVLAGIDKLDEEELAQAAKASFKEMQARFPDSEATKDEMLNDEHLELMKSSVRFLKRAAKELTVNELFNAFLVNLQDIYGMKNADNNTLREEEQFDKAIKEAKDRGTALKKLKANETKIFEAMRANGWGVASLFQRGPNLLIRTLASFYPKQFVKIWEESGKWKGPTPIEVKTPPPAPELNASDLDACAKSLGCKGNIVPTKEDKDYWREYVRFGGDAEVQRLGGALSGTTDYNKIKARYELLNTLSQFKEALDRVPV